MKPSKYTSRLVLVLLAGFIIGAEEEYYDSGTAKGITLYADREEFPPESPEAALVAALNGFPVERERFIKETLLENAGFRPTANVKFRKTTRQEKALALFSGAFHALIPSLVPMKPFYETEYAKLPQGEFYHFESVIYASPLKDVAAEVRTAMELEYMFQIWFGNGVVIQSWNVLYYTGENIARFEALARSLPESPPSIRRLKDRYLGKELPKIQAAWERFQHPDKNTLRTGENLRDILQEIKTTSTDPGFSPHGR